MVDQIHLTANTIADFFENDHREIDRIYKKINFNRPSGALELFLEFNRRLERHFGWEENVLFPSLCTIQPELENGPLFVLKGEHEQIRSSKEEALNALEHDEMKLAAEFANKMETVLHQHNLNEEHILYPICDEVLTDNALREIMILINRPIPLD